MNQAVCLEEVAINMYLNYRWLEILFGVPQYARNDGVYCTFGGELNFLYHMYKSGRIFKYL